MHQAKKPQILVQRWQLWLALIGLYGVLSGLTLVLLTRSSLQDGVEALQVGQQTLVENPLESAKSFRQASQAFEKSVVALQDAPWWSKILTPLPPFRWQVSLIKASHSLAEAGEVAAVLAESFPAIDLKNTEDLNRLLSESSSGYFGWYDKHQENFALLEQELSQAHTQLYALPTWIPLSGSLNSGNLDHKVLLARDAIQVLRSSSSSLQNSLGANDPNPHSFLVLFQNNAELRPTGGFMGSYAVITASSGIIRQFQFGQDIYKLDRIFKDQKTIPNFEPLRTITPYAGFRDSNVGFGFLAEAAPEIAQTYQEASKVPIEGIIFLDTTILEDVLKITGPITLPNSEQKISSENVRLTLTTEVEKSYFESEANRQINEPKQIIGDLIPILATTLGKTPNLASQLLPLVRNAANRKSIQVWSDSPALEKVVQAHLPVDTPLRNRNWLKIVNTNLGGMKSSLNIRQNVQINQKTQVLNNLVVYTLDIERIHQGTGEWPDANNRNLIEVYLPEKASVLELPQGRGGENLLTDLQKKDLGLPITVWQPQEITGKGWKKVSFWGTTAVGQTTNYQLSYSLPLTRENQNFLTYLKQAGSQNEFLSAFNYQGEVKENLLLAR